MGDVEPGVGRELHQPQGGPRLQVLGRARQRLLEGLAVAEVEQRLQALVARQAQAGADRQRPLGRGALGLRAEVQRQEEREGRALAGRAVKLDFSAEQVCKLAADGETEAGTALRRLSLLEPLENPLMISGRDAGPLVLDENLIGLLRLLDLDLDGGKKTQKLLKRIDSTLYEAKSDLELC